MKAALEKGRDRPQGKESQVRDGSGDAEVCGKKARKKSKNFLKST